jgi:UDP-N-acetylmuramoyl-L-alanyl-D-glutamate--2,6-diaminopimelate ligase
MAHLRDAVPHMQLEDIAALLRPVEVRGGPGDLAVEVTDLAYDSRSAMPGCLFFCLPGARDDGHRHAAEAVRAGAAAVVCERAVDVAVPQLLVPVARTAMNRLAATFFGHPSRSLDLVGVTGTNGKTTTTYMLEAIFRAAGRTPGLIGTVETRFPGYSAPGSRTTPESVDLQRLLRKMVDAGVDCCALEVTSIGLAQGRVDGTELAAGIFTNLTQDHLDFHGDMESYYRSKRALFEPERTRVALVNVDDDYGSRLAAEIAPAYPPQSFVTFGVQAPALLQALDVRLEARSTRFRAVGSAWEPTLDQVVQLPLPGAFNVSNALAATAAAAALGLSGDVIAEGLAHLGPIPGRFELVDEGQDFSVVVDYAHTPDGLERLLAAARTMAGGKTGARVVAVFGCGGDRDRAKRPLMGRAAAAGADLVYVTSDNPRSELPEAIMAGIEAGIVPSPPPLGYRLIADRAEAIAEAVAGARPGDVVVIAGKGHETTQSFWDRVVEFRDAAVAAAALRRAGRAGPAEASVRR